MVREFGEISRVCAISEKEYDYHSPRLQYQVQWSDSMDEVGDPTPPSGDKRGGSPAPPSNITGLIR